MNREILFPTPVYFKMVKDPQKLNKYLFPLIKAWSKKDKGEEKTNAGGGWHSPIDMNHKKEYQPLTDELFTMQDEIYKDYGLVLDLQQINFLNFWEPAHNKRPTIEN